MASESILSLLRQIWFHLSSRRKVQLGLLLLLMIFSSLTEVVSVGALIPFLGVLTNPSAVFAHPLAQPCIKVLSIESPIELLLPLTVMFSLAVLITGCTRLLLLWATIRISYSTGADFSYSIYERTLYQPYAVHVSRNSSDIISSISTKVGVVIFNIIQVLNIISASFLLLGILVALIVIAPSLSAIAMVGFLCIYFVLGAITRKKSVSNSYQISKNISKVVKALQEGLGGIRNVLIDSSQSAYCKVYRNADMSLRSAQASNAFITSSPRTIVEALSMVLIAVIAYFLTKNEDGLEKAIPFLGALVFGAQRILPAMQQAYGGFASLRGEKVSIKDVIDLLNQPMVLRTEKFKSVVQFEHSISLKNVGFTYAPENDWVFKNLNLSISKGSRVGIIGNTGSGKSTLLDLIMGLLIPSEGVLQVDGKTIDLDNQPAWQSNITHVPQEIFLTDSSVAENIALGYGKDDIDISRVKFAAEQAQISELIESWPEKYNTYVGERGIRLSGGQRQRIAIARALYKKASVFIFDEATSALDADTESALMHSIDSLSNEYTILIIAHRVTTLRNCDKIIELGSQGIKRICNYEDLIVSQ